MPAPAVWGVLARYMPSGLARAAAASELAPAALDRTWLIGMPAPRYVLRRLPPGTTAARARFVTAVHHHAACAGCAPRLLVNDEGEHLTTHHGQYYQLVEYVDTDSDRHAIPDIPSCAGLGQALGRLHHVLAGLSSRVTGPRLAFPTDPGAALRAACAAHDRDACPHVTARQALTAKLRRAEALSRAALDVLASLPQQVIHGDVHPGNVLASRSPETLAMPRVSLIDFERHGSRCCTGCAVTAPPW